MSGTLFFSLYMASVYRAFPDIALVTDGVKYLFPSLLSVWKVSLHLLEIVFRQILMHEKIFNYKNFKF